MQGAGAVHRIKYRKSRSLGRSDNCVCSKQIVLSSTMRGGVKLVRSEQK
jgi:hypothetical protein